MKIAVSTAPFGVYDDSPLKALNALGAEVIYNPVGRRLTEAEVYDFISDCDAVIAGTEKISADAIENSKNLKIISRVGIGLDGVDLLAARKNGVEIAYTPEAPAPAVAELTLGLMLASFRSIHHANAQMQRSIWTRHFGHRIGCSVIGVWGLGRVGTRVVQLLRAFHGVQILVFDVDSTKYSKIEGFAEVKVVESVEELFTQSDCVTLHIPLTSSTSGAVDKTLLRKMKKNALLINTARGGIVVEDDLANALQQGRLAGAAVDVFEIEPYSGALCHLDNCLLTCHMGSMSFDCRSQMEIEATNAVVSFLSSKPVDSLVPAFEYDMRTIESKR